MNVKEYSPTNNDLLKRSIMMKTKLYFIAVVVCALWVAWSVTGHSWARYEESQYFDQTFSVSGRAQVSLENVNGDVAVRRVGVGVGASVEIGVHGLGAVVHTIGPVRPRRV